MKFQLECEREKTAVGLRRFPQLPGVLAYARRADEAMSKAEVLALRVLADRLEHGESRPHSISFNVAAREPVALDESAPRCLRRCSSIGWQVKRQTGSHRTSAGRLA